MFGLTGKFNLFLTAIATFEGWFLPNSKQNPEGSISWRNKNPGNLRSSPFEAGKRYGYSYFNSDLIGWLALQWDIMQKAKGNTSTSLNGLSSLLEFCEVWAPEADGNDPMRYAEFVKDFAKLPDNFKLADLLEQ